MQIHFPAAWLAVPKIYQVGARFSRVPRRGRSLRQPKLVKLIFGGIDQRGAEVLQRVRSFPGFEIGRSARKPFLTEFSLLGVINPADESSRSKLNYQQC